jgi:hypothetical protein
VVTVIVAVAETVLMLVDNTIVAATVVVALVVELELVYCPETNDDGCSPSSKKSRRPVQREERGIQLSSFSRSCILNITIS